MRGIVVIAVALLTSACADPQEPVPPAAAVRFERVSAEPIVHGERIANVLGCTGCHGADLTGEDWSEPGFGQLWTANLTRAVPRYTDTALAEVIRSGKRTDRALWEMPSHLFTRLADADMSALIAYLRSKPPQGPVHPDPVFEEGARREIAAGNFVSSAAQVKAEGFAWPPYGGEDHSLGRYIARATCAECHGMNLSGGQPNPAAVPRPNLRMVAGYEPEQFRRLLRTGIASGDREVSLMSEVARERYKHLTDAEIDALYRYLRRVAEVDP